VSDKADSAKSTGNAAIEGYAETMQYFKAVGHQALATRLIDGRRIAVGHKHAQTALPRGKSTGQSRRTSADHKNICLVGMRHSRLPAQQKQLGAEARAHGGENTIRARLAAFAFEYLFQNHQHRR
jgi:hypothetical protein